MEAKPDPSTFYDDFMKRGGKKGKKKAKAKKYSKVVSKQRHDMTMSNQPNTGVYSFQSVPRPMINPPGVFNPSHYGIAPTQIVDFRRPPEHQSGMAPTAPIARDWGHKVHTTTTPHTTLDVPARSVTTYMAHENPRDIAPLNTNASRAIPTELRPRGGVLYEQAGNSMSVAFGYPESKEELDESAYYFKPTGRDNIPFPVPSKVTGAPPVDFFPLRAQNAVSREDEQIRSAWQTPPPIHVGRHPAPSGYASGASTPRDPSPAPSSVSDAPGMAVPGRKPLLPKHLWPEGIKDIRYNEKGQKSTSYNPAPHGVKMSKHYNEVSAKLKAVEKEHGYKRGGVFC